jgi:ATP-binding cassette subfamily B protein
MSGRLGEKGGLLWPLFRAHWRPYLVGFIALFIVDVLDLLPTLLIKQAIDRLALKGPVSAIAALALGYSLIVFIQGWFRYVWRIFLIGTSFHIDKELRCTLIQKVFRMRPDVAAGLSPGELMGHATQDVDAVRMAMGSGLLVGLDAVLYLLLLPPLLIWLDAGLALAVAAPMAFVPFFVFWFGKNVHSRFSEVQEEFGVVTEVTRETLGAILQVKLAPDPLVFVRRFQAANMRFLEKNLRLVQLQALIEPFLEGVGAFALVLLMVVGGLGVIRGDVSLGTFVAFQRYISMMVWPMVAIGWSSAVIQRGRGSAARLLRVLKQQSEPDAMFEPKLQLSPFYELRAEGISFGYGAEALLEGVSLAIGSNDRLAIVGRIGSGKSSLINLLAGVLEPKSGVVLLNGANIRSVNYMTRSRLLGVVDAEAVLFSMTLQENITLGLVGSVMPDKAEMLEALRVAGFEDDDLQKLPDGLETLLGERGMTLSGGQRQRIALARAILRKPGLLILDDALSQLDYETEAKILNNLAEKNMAIVLATNRLHTLRFFKRVYLLRAGRIFPAVPEALDRELAWGGLGGSAQGDAHDG